jgi:hypothetical protein
MALGVQFHARRATAPVHRKRINVSFSGQKESQKAYASYSTGLIETQEHQLLAQPCFLYASPNILPKVANALNSVFG